METSFEKIKKRTSHHITIAHWSYKAYSFILKQEQPQCLTCQMPCTIKHILKECRAFAVIRKRFFKVNSLIDLFENVKMYEVLSFCERQGCSKNMNFNRLIACKQIKSCLSKILPTKYSFRNLRLNVYRFKQNLVLNNLQRLICHKTQPASQPANQPTTYISP